MFFHLISICAHALTAKSVPASVHNAVLSRALFAGCIAISRGAIGGKRAKTRARKACPALRKFNRPPRIQSAARQRQNDENTIAVASTFWERVNTWRAILANPHAPEFAKECARECLRERGLEEKP